MSRSKSRLARIPTTIYPYRALTWPAVMLFLFILALSAAPAAASTNLSVATTAKFTGASPSTANPTACGGAGQSTCSPGSAPVQIRWGSPASGNGRSGLGFTPNDGAVPVLGTPFMVGSLSHYNFPIYDGATQAQMTINVVIREDTTVIFNAPVNITFQIDETPNSEPCPYPSATPCSDRIRISGAGGGPSAQTVLGFTAYTLQILGFKDTADSASNPVTEFISDEGAQRTGYLFAQLTLSSAVVANAGSDQAVDEGAPVALNGSGSQPADVAYAWTQTGGPAVALAAADTAAPTFTAPQVAANTILTFRLVTTGSPYTDDDEVTVTVRNVNVGPTANPGGPYSAPEGGTVALGGAGSDPDSGDTLSYAWDLDNNGSYETSGQDVPFAVGTRDGPGSATVWLKVCDNHGACDTASAAVALTNVAPTAAITGAPASISYGTALSLNSSVSDPSAADMTAGFTYAWSVTRDGEPAAFSSSTAAFSFTPAGIGTYVVTLTATDQDDGAATTTATIAVAPATLTVTAQSVSRAYGAANPALTAGYSGFVNGDDEHDLSGDLACTTAATAASPADHYAIDCASSTLASPNYTIGYVAGTLTVTPASTTTSVDDASGMAGQSTTLSATVISPAGPVNEGSVEFTVKQGGSTIGSPVSGAVAAGTATVSFSLVGVAVDSYSIEARYLPAASPNFAASADATTGTLAVIQPIIVTNLSVSGSGSYGSPATLTATLTTAGGDPLPGKVVALTLNGAAVCNTAPACPTTNASGIATLTGVSTAGLQGSTPYALAASYAGEVGYQASAATGSLTLARIGQSLSFNALTAATYGDGPLNLVASASSSLPVAFTASGPCEIVGSQVRLTGAGGCTVTASQPGDGNYLGTTPVSRAFAIAKKALTVRPADQTVKFGASPPCVPASGYPQGLAYSDTLASLGGMLTCTSTPAVPTALGTYPLAASGLSSDNYTISYVGARLTVVACPVTLVLDMPANNEAQYSDRLALAAHAVNCGGATYPTGGVQFRFGTATLGSAQLNGQGVANLPITIMNSVGDYKLTAMVSPTDIRFTGGSAGPVNLTVTPEEATASYSGGLTFAVNNVTKRGTVQLKATVTDITAIDPDGDPRAGDIRTARVRFERPDGSSLNAACDNVMVGLVSANDTKVGTATCSFQSAAATFHVRVVVLGNYTGQSAATPTITVGNGGVGTRAPASVLEDRWATRREEI